MEYEVGMIQSWDRLHFRAAAWYYDIRDFINDNGITAPMAGAGSNCLYNIDSVELYGLEVEASLQVSEKFRITASYVFQEHDISQTGFEQDWTYYLPATLPKHKVKVLAAYEIIPEGWIQLSSRFVGSRGSQKGAELNDYAVCDLGFRKAFRLGGLDYDLNLFADNITGTRYEEIAGYPMPRYVWGITMGVSF
ncbi:MAG: TonB-dependent receptor [Desulfobacter sp.]|nr:MAG: TonB-dependent receptor [Desulfobacter sp.]